CNQISERAPAARHNVHHTQSSQQAITSRGVAVAKDNVTGLLAAERSVGLHHFFEDVLVANIGAQHANPRIAQRDFQAHVRHGGRDHCVAAKNSAAEHVAGGEEQNAVSVYYAAGGVAEEGAIGVAIKRDAEIEFARCRCDLPCGSLRMKRATTLAYIFAVGRSVDELGLNSTSAKQLGSFGSSSAVCAI